MIVKDVKILTIIVTYNGMKWIDKCLSSIIGSSAHSDIYVVDNCSTDDTVAYIETNYPNVIIEKSQTNLGFAKANNVGMRYALDNGYDFVFLLNQDAWVDTTTLEYLTRTFEDNTNVGIATPIHLNGSRSTLDYGFANCMQTLFLMDLYANALQHYYQVPFVNAAAWMISRYCLETVGGFDTLLFHHYEEDQNYCQRVSYHSKRIIVNSCCCICHDREQRDWASYEGRDIWKNQNQNSFFKVEWGDINQHIDIKKKILKNVIRIISFSLAFRWKRAKEYIAENDLLKQIAESRKVNEQTGTSWL